MTKRELCKRLMEIRDQLSAGHLGPVGIKDALRDLLLDLAAPEDEPKSAEPHPGVLAKPGKDGKIEWCWCQKCYAHAAVVHDPFGDGEDWSYCKKCGVSFRLKRRAEERKKPPARFAYATCECGGKAYIKARIREDETPVAKCAKCGRIIEGEKLALSCIVLTEEQPPENLFAEEGK